MSKTQNYYVISDEYYPWYSISDALVSNSCIKLTKEEIADYNRVCDEWEKWQERLASGK